MEILIKLGLILLWFSAVVTCGTAYLLAVIFAIRKGWLGEASAKVVYFSTFVILATVAFKSPLL